MEEPNGQKVIEQRRVRTVKLIKELHRKGYSLRQDTSMRDTIICNASKNRFAFGSSLKNESVMLIMYSISCQPILVVLLFVTLF
jgi:hypothetical protein